MEDRPEDIYFICFLDLGYLELLVFAAGRYERLLDVATRTVSQEALRAKQSSHKRSTVSAAL